MRIYTIERSYKRSMVELRCELGLLESMVLLYQKFSRVPVKTQKAIRALRERCLALSGLG